MQLFFAKIFVFVTSQQNRRHFTASARRLEGLSRPPSRPRLRHRVQESENFSVGNFRFLRRWVVWEFLWASHRAPSQTWTVPWPRARPRGRSTALSKDGQVPPQPERFSDRLIQKNPNILILLTETYRQWMILGSLMKSQIKSLCLLVNKFHYKC